MKIRASFVSNSSSSSFCIVGLYLDNKSELQDRFGVDHLNHIKFPEDIKNKLETYSPEGEDGWIGISIFYMKEEETLLQFKHRSLAYINSVVPEGKEKFTMNDIKLHVDEYYD